jgi:RND family efflux transporter MFP subunit
MKKAVILIMALAVLSACEKKQEKAAKPAPFIELEDAVSKTVPYVIRTIGNTEAYQTVDIQPQVSGELTGYYFTDGQDVAEGDLLFTIDPDLYKAELEQARGQNLQARAQLKYSQEKLERYTPLVPDDYVSALDFDQFSSEVEEAKGEVLSTKGSVDKAKVNLGYATITAPFAGRLGRHLVDPGNIVHPEEKKPLVTINQISPIYAMISIPEKYFSEIMKYNQKSKEGLDVEISVIGNDEVKHKGRLDFIDNTVNPKSGTLTVRAVMPNEDKSLWPGQFLHAAIELYMIENAVLVPSEAVGLDTEGHFIFVADEDTQTVELRRVELGQIWDKRQVVMKGVKAGEKVVTNGQLALTPGSKYRLKKTEAEGS